MYRQYAVRSICSRSELLAISTYPNQSRPAHGVVNRESHCGNHEDAFVLTKTWVSSFWFLDNPPTLPSSCQGRAAPGTTLGVELCRSLELCRQGGLFSCRALSLHFASKPFSGTAASSGLQWPFHLQGGLSTCKALSRRGLAYGSKPARLCPGEKPSHPSLQRPAAFPAFRLARLCPCTLLQCLSQALSLRHCSVQWLF